VTDPDAPPGPSAAQQDPAQQDPAQPDSAANANGRSARVPFLSVLTVVDSADALRGIDGTFASLEEQTDSGWQWCVVVTADVASGAAEILGRLVGGDLRCPIIAAPGESLAAANATALSVATGVNVGFVDAGDQLDVNTVKVLRREVPPGRWAYSDEAKVNDFGGVTQTWFKSEYSPEMLLSQPYAVRLAVLPRRIVEANGFSEEAGSACNYDVVLRVSEQCGPAVHVLGPYYLHGPLTPDHAPPYVEALPQDRCRVVARALERRGRHVLVRPVEVAGRALGQQVVRTPLRTPKVSIVIPTRGSSSLIFGFDRCHVVDLVTELWSADRYVDLELVVVHDTSTPAWVIGEIERVTDGHWVSVEFHGPFNFSRKCNAGALAAGGEYLCFLNDDVEIVTRNWLDQLVSLLDDPDVGAAGLRLSFADGTLQHAGHLYDGGNAGHLMFGEASDSLSWGGAAHLAGERSGVTAACLLMRTEDFQEIGGFSEQFPLNYNDVDLCLKIRSLGRRIVYTPHAQMYHFESQTRVPVVTNQELVRMRRRWLPWLETDPFLNPLVRAKPLVGWGR